MGGNRIVSISGSSENFCYIQEWGDKRSALCSHIPFSSSKIPSDVIHFCTSGLELVHGGVLAGVIAWDPPLLPLCYLHNEKITKL